MGAALILDFDGTMAPTEHVRFYKWRDFFAQHDFELTMEYFVGGIGRVGATQGVFHPWTHALEMGLGDRSTIEPRLRALQLEYLEKMELLPGVRELVVSAVEAGIPLGIASSSETEWVSGHLERFGLLQHFTSIRTRDHGPGKPHPDLYQMVLQDLGAEAGSSWAIEDSGPGVTSAKTAGLRCVVVPHELTATHDVSGADRTVKTLSEVSLEELFPEL